MSNVAGRGLPTCPNDALPALPDILGWDVVNWSQALAFWTKHARLLSSASCLEIGCGDGSSLALWLAMLGHSVVCSDFGGVPERIKETHRRHGVADRISYADVDARTMSYKNRFDVIALKSVLGGVVREAPAAVSREVVSRIHDALKPGGALLLAENLRATPLHQFARSYFIGRKSTWHYFASTDIGEMLGGFSSVETTTFGVLGCFGRTEAQRRWLGKIDRWGLDNLVPASWHYVAAAVAHK
jgi:SAM-dependent methyltransferase